MDLGLALIARLAAIIPPPRCHVVRYSGVISSHASLRSQIVPVPAVAAPEENDKSSLPLSHYISWSQLLKKSYGRLNKRWYASRDGYIVHGEPAPCEGVPDR